jgi:hypothetical protein
MFLLSLRDDITHAERVFELSNGAALKRLPDHYWAKQLNALLVRSLQQGNSLSETRVRALLDRLGEPADIRLVEPPP